MSEDTILASYFLTDSSPSTSPLAFLSLLRKCETQFDDVIEADPATPVDPAALCRPQMHADTRTLNLSNPAWELVETYELSKSDPVTDEQVLQPVLVPQFCARW